MTADRWTYADSYGPWIEPIRDLLSEPVSRLTDDDLMLVVDRPADLFDDWPVVMVAVRDLAAVARDGGFVGVVFDNEAYSESV
ncbi:MAG: hypothetical protein AAF108_10815 [Planctomycetota bacterium]